MSDQKPGINPITLRNGIIAGLLLWAIIVALVFLPSLL